MASAVTNNLVVVKNEEVISKLGELEAIMGNLNKTDLLDTVLARGHLIVCTNALQTCKLYQVSGDSVFTTKPITYIDGGVSVTTTYDEYVAPTITGYIADLLKNLITFIFGVYTEDKLVVLKSNTTTRFVFTARNMVDLNFHYATSTYSRTQNITIDGKVTRFLQGPTYYSTGMDLGAVGLTDVQKASTEFTTGTLQSQLEAFANIFSSPITILTAADCTAQALATNIQNQMTGLLLEDGVTPVTFALVTELPNDVNGVPITEYIYIQDSWVIPYMGHAGLYVLPGTRAEIWLNLKDNLMVNANYNVNAQKMFTAINLVKSVLYDLDKNSMSTLAEYNTALTANIIQAIAMRDVQKNFYNFNNSARYASVSVVSDYAAAVLNGTGALAQLSVDPAQGTGAVNMDDIADLYKYTTTSAQ